MKRLLNVCLSLLMMVGLCNMQVIQTKADGLYESEPNNSAAYADSVGLGDSMKAKFNNESSYSWDDDDVYKFTLPSQGKFVLDVTSYVSRYDVKIMNVSGDDVWSSTYNDWNESLGFVNDVFNLYLEKGTYYILFKGYTGDYQFKTKFTSSKTTDDDENNSYATATKLSMGVTMVGQISENDEYDIYKVKQSLNGYLQLDLKSYMNTTELNVYNSDGSSAWYDNYIYSNEELGYAKNSYKIKLNAGTYYIKVSSYYTGKYNLKANYLFTTSKPKTTARSNSATSIKVGWNKISGANGYVIYRATSKSGKYSKIATAGSGARSYINKGLTTGKTYYYRVKAYKSSGTNKFYSGMNSGVACKPVPKKTTGLKTSSRSSSSVTLTWTKQSGMSGYEVYRATSEYGKFSRVASVTSNKFTNKKRSSGTYYYYKVRAYKTVNGKKVFGSFSHIHETVTRPKRTSITNKSSNYSEEWNLFWNSVKCDDYQIQISRNKDFSKGKIYERSEWDVNLTSKKRYYFRVRAYRLIGDDSKVTGAWSSPVSMIIK